MSLEGGANPNNRHMAMAKNNGNNAAMICSVYNSTLGACLDNDFVDIRGLDFRDSAAGVAINGMGDEVEGCNVANVSVGINADRYDQLSLDYTAANNVVVNASLNSINLSAFGIACNANGALTGDPTYYNLAGATVVFTSSYPLAGANNNPFPASISSGALCEYNVGSSGVWTSNTFYLGLVPGQASEFRLYLTQSAAIADNAGDAITLNAGDANWAGKEVSGASYCLALHIAIQNTSEPTTTISNCWIVNAQFEAILGVSGSNLCNQSYENGVWDAAAGVDVVPGRGTYVCEYSTIVDSDWAGYNAGWEGGDEKANDTTAAIWRYNTFLDDAAEPTWLDTGNYDDVYDGNLILNSAAGGFMVEADPGPNLIENNIVSGMIDEYGENGLSAAESDQTWAVNNTIDAGNLQSGAATGAYTGSGEDVTRGTFWNGATTPAWDATQAFVNNATVNCGIAILADGGEINGSGDTIADNYTTDAADPYLGTLAESELAYQGYMGFDDSLNGQTVPEYLQNAPDYRLLPSSPLNDAGTRTADFTLSDGTQANVVSYATMDFDGLLRQIPGDPQSAGAMRPYMAFADTVMEWELADGTQQRCVGAISQPGNCGNLVAHWSLGANEGATAADSSGQGNNAAFETAGDSSRLPSPTSSFPGAVVAADFNGDGKLDLATANYGGTVSVLLGNGDGGFAQAVNYAAGANPVAIAAGDLFDDGIEDLVVADSNGTISILLGNGDGTFQAPISLAVGGANTGVALGDFNGDGKLGIVVVDSAATNNVFVLEQTSASSSSNLQFSTATLSADQSPSAVAVADFNGDRTPTSPWRTRAPTTSPSFWTAASRAAGTRSRPGSSRCWATTPSPQVPSRSWPRTSTTTPTRTS